MTARPILPLLAATLLTLNLACTAESTSPDPPLEQPNFIRGEVIVRYHKDLDESSESDVLERHSLDRIRRFEQVRVDHVSIRDARDVLAKIAELEQDPDVLYAEPNYLYYARELPDDFTNRQWWLHNDGSYGKVDADIDAPEAWEISKGSHSVVVAVTDTGLDWDHPDIYDNLWVNSGEVQNNGVDDDGNGYTDDIIGWDFYSGDNNPDDDDGHGTHVAGAVGAVGNNGTGVSGVNWNVSIMPLRIMGPQGASTSASVAAIEYAVNNGARVINASWGGPGYSHAIRDAIAYANEHEVLFVTASGNDGRNSDQMSNYPNNYDQPNIVSVTSTDWNDRMSDFSTYGATTVDLAAPGSGIYSTYRGGGYQYLDGTSMSSPIVAGAAALALSVDPGLTVHELKDLMMGTVDPLSDLQGWCVTGGRLNVGNMVAALGGSSVPPVEEESPPEEEEEEPPPEEEEPVSDDWKWVDHAISSDHPYGNDFEGYATISQSGASEIRLVFDRFETEQGYDYVHLQDPATEEVVTSYSGTLGGFTTDPVEGDSVNLWLVTDYSVTAYGIDLAGYEWR